MRLLFATLIIASIATNSIAQSIPPRFQSLGKDSRLQLKRILGSPEMHPTFNPSTAFTADGKRAIYVEDLTTGGEDKPSFRARIHVWDVVSKAWPREIEIAGK